MRIVIPTSAAYIIAFGLYWIDNSAMSERPQGDVQSIEYGPIELDFELDSIIVEPVDFISDGTPCLVSDDPWVCFLDDPDDKNLALEILNQEASDWPNDYRGRFLRSIGPAVLMSAKNNDLFPSVIFSQAILETGWGRSKLAKQSNNLFGIKAFGKVKKVHYPTIESVDGKRVTHISPFRVFDSWDDSIDYHGRLLRKDRRYKQALYEALDWKSYIEFISKSYATEPTYVARISSIIKKYKLDRWDEKMLAAR